MDAGRPCWNMACCQALAAGLSLSANCSSVPSGFSCHIRERYMERPNMERPSRGSRPSSYRCDRPREELRRSILLGHRPGSPEVGDLRSAQAANRGTGRKRNSADLVTIGESVVRAFLKSKEK